MINLSDMIKVQNQAILSSNIKTNSDILYKNLKIIK